MSGLKQYRMSVYTGRAILVSVFTSFLFLLSASSAFAQVGERVDAPVTVKVESKTDAFGFKEKQAFVPLGGTAQISGTSVPLGDNDTVKIDITVPNKSTELLNGKLTAEGTYAVNFTKTNTPGAYAVTAKSPDGKSTAKASFTVVSALELGETTDKLFSSLTQIANKTGKAVHAVKELLDAREDFPDREQIKHDIGEIEEVLKQLPKRTTDMRDALDQFSKLIEQNPGAASVPELGEVVKELSDALDDAETMNEQLNDLPVSVSNNGSSFCDRMDAATEALNATGLVFDLFTGTWLMRVNTLIMSTGLPDDIYNAAFPNDALGFAGKTAFTETVKNSVDLFMRGADAMEDYLTSPTGLILTLTQTMLHYGFGNLCERFVGPIEGEFSVDSTVGGKRFWAYNIHIKGRLILRYATWDVGVKSPVPMTGEFEGTATKIHSFEDLFVMSNLVKYRILAHLFFPPVAFGESINWVGLKAGSLPAMTIPYYFKVPVNGSYLFDVITIEVAPTAQRDFDDLRMRAFYVTLPSSLILIPIVERFDVPMQNAQFILSRGLRNTATMKVETGKTPNGSLLKTIEQTFTREEVVSDGEVTVKWNLNVKACNPECP